MELAQGSQHWETGLKHRTEEIPTQKVGRQKQQPHLEFPEKNTMHLKTPALSDQPLPFTKECIVSLH